MPYGYLCTMEARSLSGESARFRALDVLFQFVEGRALRREQHLAPELDRDRRRIAVDAGQQGHFDALEHLGRLVQFLFEQCGKRTDNTVGQQNTEESPD